MKSFLTNLLVSAAAALAPIKPVMITVGILIVSDLITGIWAARKRGETITSAALGRTVSKMVVYQTAVVTGFLLQRYLLADAMPIVNIVGGVIGLVEFKSFIENSNVIVGRDIMAEIIKKLGSKNLIQEIAEKPSDKKKNLP
jgi:hypothetical protein